MSRAGTLLVSGILTSVRHSFEDGYGNDCPKAEAHFIWTEMEVFSRDHEGVGVDFTRTVVRQDPEPPEVKWGVVFYLPSEGSEADGSTIGASGDLGVKGPDVARLPVLAEMFAKGIEEAQRLGLLSEPATMEAAGV